jgi:dihydrofolate synthase/folylpolyglutamate synthase
VNVRAYLQSLEQFGIKLGLDQIRALVEHLGRPQDEFRSIVVAGTNGKGSVTAMIERGLRAAGYRTGRYISPHLVALEERFAIDGKAVGAHTLDRALGHVRNAAQDLPHPPSYFEATTAAALELFRQEDVEIAVLEVGLGGRLDATNVVTPVGVAITSIDFDHEVHLGTTIEQIAAEKAGVIKRGTFAILGANPPAVQEVVRRTASTAGARFTYAPAGVTTEIVMARGQAHGLFTTPRGRYPDLRLGLRGRHQVDNAVTALRFLEELSAHGLAPVSDGAIRAGLRDVEWPARLELVDWRGGEVLIDGAHNPAGARALAAYVEETYARRVPFVVGIMKDKQLRGILDAIASVASHVIFTAASSDRAARPDALQADAAVVRPDLPTDVILPPMDAVAAAQDLGAPVVVAGSLYLAGEVRQVLLG